MMSMLMPASGGGDYRGCGCSDWGKDLQALECEQPEGYVLKDLELRLVDKKGYPAMISNDGELFNVKVELVGIHRWVTSSTKGTDSPARPRA